MSYIPYIFFRIFVWIIKVLPYSAIYTLSNFLYIVFYYIIRYRRVVVSKNIKFCYPKKSNDELKPIIKSFYRNLGDITIEGIKGFSMTKEELKKRYKYINPELVNNLIESGKNVILAGTHFANWEWGVLTYANPIKYDVHAIYKPIKNRFIERFTKKIRDSGGMNIIDLKGARDKIMEIKDTRFALVLLGDQSPTDKKRSHWSSFLGNQIMVLHGIEAYSYRLNMSVVYMDITRVSRGNYEVSYKLISNNKESHNTGDISSRYMHEIEKTINRDPGSWLWSHKRFKHIKDTSGNIYNLYK